MIGLIFGRLLVLELVGRNKHSKKVYKCKCDCGKIKNVVAQELKSGDTKSCGCLGLENRIKSRKIHGLSKKNNPEYEIWKGMKARCYNKNHAKYPDYGGRGIKVCRKWKYSFLAFIKDMGKRPSQIHSLDRFPNVNGDYEMANCRWATPEQQSRNKRNNRYFTINDKSMIMEDWAKYFGVHQSTLCEHLRTKTFETIFNFYEKKKVKRQEIEGKIKLAIQKSLS